MSTYTPSMSAPRRRPSCGAVSTSVGGVTPSATAKPCTNNIVSQGGKRDPTLTPAAAAPAAPGAARMRTQRRTRPTLDDVLTLGGRDADGDDAEAEGEAEGDGGAGSVEEAFEDAYADAAAAAAAARHVPDGYCVECEGAPRLRGGRLTRASPAQISRRRCGVSTAAATSSARFATRRSTARAADARTPRPPTSRPRPCRAPLPAPPPHPWSVVPPPPPPPA